MIARSLRSQCEPDAVEFDPAVLSINEVSPRSDTHWVELHNAGDRPICLDGFFLDVTDLVGGSVLGPRGSVGFRDGAAVPPGGFHVVCLHVDGDPEGVSLPGLCESCLPDSSGERCRDAAMDPRGGTVALWWSPQCQSVLAEKIDSLRYPPLPPARTFGRLDGETVRYGVLSEPTPGRENSPGEAVLEEVVLSEVSTGPQTSFRVNGSFPDWVELHAPGPVPVDVAGFRLISEDRALEFPGGHPELTVIEPGGYLVVICDGKGTEIPCCDRERGVTSCCEQLECFEFSARISTCFDGAFFHAPFRLERNGESLVLLDPSGVTDRLAVPRLEDGEVFARSSSGEWFRTSCATPGEPNPAEEIACRNAPHVELLDRRPIKVVPESAIEVWVRVSDADGDVQEVTLRWWLDGEEDDVRESSMRIGKRITCRRTPEEGVFQGAIPGPVASAPGRLFYEVTAADARGSAGTAGPVSVRVQDPGVVFALRINEVAAAGTLFPDGGDLDPQPGDWIELVNTASTPRRAGGLYVTDSVFELDNRRLSLDIPTIPPGGFLVLHTSGNASNGTPLAPHLPFRLNRCSDKVIVYDRDGETVVDFLELHEEKRSASTGRVPDGVGEAIGLMRPTPGAANAFSSCLSWGFELGIAGAALVINEVAADNWRTIHDGRREFGDWVEIYNRGRAIVDLMGWSLRDGGDEWQFPDWTLDPGARLLVWCDNDEECENLLNGELHASFEINRLGDLVELVDPAGTVVDRVELSFQFRDVTVGRAPDGADSVGFLVPTPAAPNGEELLGRLPRPRSCSCLFLRGDAHADGAVNLSDAVAVLEFLFRGGKEPMCLDAADANDSGRIDLSDAIYTLTYLFAGGPPPPPPFLRSGLDPTADGFTCSGPCASGDGRP